MKQNMNAGRFTAMWIMILLLLAALICSSGCIRMVQESTHHILTGKEAPQNTIGLNITPTHPEITRSSLQQDPVVEMTPAKSDIVTEVAPFLTPDPYPIMHGTRINATPLENPLDRNPEFEKDYSLRGNSSGLLVNVAEAPLYIVYEVTPDYDCLKEPESCRGTGKAPINIPYLTITVRDNQTQEIVAEDGYGREFSSDIGHYEFVITKTNADGSATTTTSTPGPRSIKIYREGVFHVTLEGNYLNVNVKILTGTSPSRLDVGNGDQSTQTGTSPEDSW